MKENQPQTVKKRFNNQTKHKVDKQTNTTKTSDRNAASTEDQALQEEQK